MLSLRTHTAVAVVFTRLARKHVTRAEPQRDDTDTVWSVCPATVRW